MRPRPSRRPRPRHAPAPAPPAPGSTSPLRVVSPSALSRSAIWRPVPRVRSRTPAASSGTPHAALDSADRAPMHAVDARRGPPPLSTRQGSPYLANLSIQVSSARMVISPRMSPIPQAVGRVALPIPQVEVLRPVVSHIIIAVAYELVPAKLPAQDHRHHRAMEHDPAFPCLSI